MPALALGVRSNGLYWDLPRLPCAALCTSPLGLLSLSLVAAVVWLFARGQAPHNKAAHGPASTLLAS